MSELLDNVLNKDKNKIRKRLKLILVKKQKVSAQLFIFLFLHQKPTVGHKSVNILLTLPPPQISVGEVT